MPSTPTAVLIDLDGHTTAITLPSDPDLRATVIKAVTNSHSLEAVDITDSWAMWLDETGGMLGRHRRPLNPAASAMANRHGVQGGIRGPVVITGTSPAGTVPFTAADVAAIKVAIQQLDPATA